MDDERLAEMGEWVKNSRSWGAHQAAELMDAYKEIAEKLRKISYGPRPTPAPTKCICEQGDKSDSHCPQHWQDAFSPEPESDVDAQEAAIDALRKAGHEPLAGVLEACLRLKNEAEEGSDASPWTTQRLDGLRVNHAGTCPDHEHGPCVVSGLVDDLKAELVDCQRLDEALVDAMDRLSEAHEKIDSLKAKVKRLKRERAQPVTAMGERLHEGRITEALNSLNDLPSCGIAERNYEGCYVRDAVNAVRGALCGEDIAPPVPARRPKSGDRVKVEIIGTYCEAPGMLHGVRTSGGYSYFYNEDEASFTVREAAADD